MPFINLVLNVMESKVNITLESERIVCTLLNHEGLLTSIVQWGYWKERRPDILNELNSQDWKYYLEGRRLHIYVQYVKRSHFFTVE